MLVAVVDNTTPPLGLRTWAQRTPRPRGSFFLVGPARLMSLAEGGGRGNGCRNRPSGTAAPTRIRARFQEGEEPGTQRRKETARRPSRAPPGPGPQPGHPADILRQRSDRPRVEQTVPGALGAPQRRVGQKPQSPTRREKGPSRGDAPPTGATPPPGGKPEPGRRSVHLAGFTHRKWTINTPLSMLTALQHMPPLGM